MTRRPLTLLILASAAIAFVPTPLRAYCGPAVAGNDGWPIVAPAARVFDQDACCKASYSAREPAGNAMSYCFQWWHGEVKTAHGPIGWVGAQGNGGQLLYLVPELDLVVVVTAGQYYQPDTSWRAPLTVFRRVVTELAKHPRSASQTALPPQ